MIASGASPGTASRAAVWLHGRGGAAGPMLEMAGQLRLDNWRWVAPAAPNGTWYPKRFMEPIDQNEPWLSKAIASTARALDEASEAGRLFPSQLAVVGFSQGACLVTELLLRRPGAVKTAVVFTGGLIGPPGTTWRLAPPAESLAGLRVLLTGSDIDEWVPEARVRETAQVLQQLGATVTLRIFAGRPHIVSDEELTLARKLLAGV